MVMLFIKRFRSLYLNCVKRLYFLIQAKRFEVFFIFEESVKLTFRMQVKEKRKSK